MSMASSSVTRAGGFCGAASAGACCPKARAALSNPAIPKTIPKEIDGHRGRDLDFVCIGSLLQGTMEALDPAFRQKAAPEKFERLDSVQFGNRKRSLGKTLGQATH